jgi:uncharacterized delta-60 repeat protein
MKVLLFSFALLACVVLSTAASAQVVTVAVVDTTFASAMGGKVETAFLGYGDEATDLDVLFDGKITVCGKVGDLDSGIKHFGIIRLNANGTFDSSFGTNGKAMPLWGMSEYPNDIYLPGEGSIFAVGASLYTSVIPTLFRLKSNGSTDNSFGVGGIRPVSYDEHSSGEFSNMFPEDTTYIACGYIRAVNESGHSGFYAVRFKSNGESEPSFGTNGMAYIPVSVHSAMGFLLKDGLILFSGVMDSNGQSVVVLGRLTAKGLPDETFGNHGLLNTGIVLTAGTEMKSAIQQDFKIDCAIPMLGPNNTRPFTIVRFLPTGMVDSSYGQNGFVTVPISEQTTCYGINIANNGKAVINGSAMVNGHENSASTRIDLVGLPDLSFNKTGMAVVDVDNGAYSNYISRFVGIGLKRYMAIGGSIQNGKNKFLVARFKDDTVKIGGVSMSGTNPSVHLWPNPATTSISIDASVEHLQIIDALGREVIVPLMNDNAEHSVLSLDTIPNGVYYCSGNIGARRFTEKFIVAK